LVKVKICGLTSLEDALAAYNCGADLLGFIFVKDTPRYIKNIKDVIIGLPQSLKNRVGVFKDESPGEVAQIVSDCDLNYVQLHGSEGSDYCSLLKKILQEKYSLSVKIIKTIKVGKDIPTSGPDGFMARKFVDYFLFDTFHPAIPGGTGLEFNRTILLAQKEKIEKPFLIAGGLVPGNVKEAVRMVRPYGVDVSSGVERTRGKKDKELLKEFIQNAKNA